MKKLISAITFAIIISVLVAACSGKNKNGDAMQERQPAEDSVSMSDPDGSESVRGRVVLDTVIGHWAIKATIDSNDVIIRSNELSIRDSSVFLTVSYNNTTVYSDKEIRTKDITGSDGKYMMGWFGEIFWASNSAIYLPFRCYMPDSDDGWNMLYQILPDGTSNLSEFRDEMGVDGSSEIAFFMALYLNERVAGASAADLKRLYDLYCTKELAEALSSAAIPIISDDTDFRNADHTLQINSLDDQSGPPLEKYSFEVKFKPNPKDNNVTDIIYMEVDGTTNKISKIESGERKMI